jgi:hypothetical protein
MYLSIQHSSVCVHAHIHTTKCNLFRSSFKPFKSCIISSPRCGCTCIPSLELDCVYIHHSMICSARAIGLMPKESWFDSRKKRESSLLGNAQGGSGSHPAFYSSASQIFLLTDPFSFQK